MDAKEKYQLSQVKVLARQKVKALSGDSEWDLVQQIAQEIEAHHLISERKVSLAKLLELIKEEVKARYSDQPDLLEIVEESIPSVMTLSNWKKKKGWEDAVWMKIRGEGLFTSDRRAKVINTLFEQASSKGNVNAAKVWLTLSGDYVEKGDNGKSEAIDMFRQMNEAIHSKPGK